MRTMTHWRSLSGFARLAWYPHFNSFRWEARYILPSLPRRFDPRGSKPSRNARDHSRGCNDRVACNCSRKRNIHVRTAISCIIYRFNALLTAPVALSIVAKSRVSLIFLCAAITYFDWNFCAIWSVNKRNLKRELIIFGSIEKSRWSLDRRFIVKRVNLLEISMMRWRTRVTLLRILNYK